MVFLFFNESQGMVIHYYFPPLLINHYPFEGNFLFYHFAIPNHFKTSKTGGGGGKCSFYSFYLCLFRVKKVIELYSLCKDDLASLFSLPQRQKKRREKQGYSKQ